VFGSLSLLVSELRLQNRGKRRRKRVTQRLGPESVRECSTASIQAMQRPGPGGVQQGRAPGAAARQGRARDAQVVSRRSAPCGASRPPEIRQDIHTTRALRATMRMTAVKPRRHSGHRRA
jgi:hypothetical protein